MDKLSFKVAEFEGPLDLLLHLIDKHKLDIYDIPIFELVEQYCAHIENLQEKNMNVSSEFLEMAARLVYIKTVSLLPRKEEAEELKRELTGELLEYRDCQLMAQKLSEIANGFGFFSRKPMKLPKDIVYKQIHDPKLLVKAYQDAVGNGRRKLPPPAAAFQGIVERRIVPVATKIISVMRRLWNGSVLPFRELFTSAKSRSEMVATFLAVLELVKAKRINVDEFSDEGYVRIVKETEQQEEHLEEDKEKSYVMAE